MKKCATSARPAAFALALLACSNTSNAESVCGFDGNRWQTGVDAQNEPVYDQGMTLGYAQFKNNALFLEIPQPFDANGDGIADTGKRLPWRTEVTPDAAVYATTNSNTHAGSAPIWGGWEWIAHNTNSVAGGLGSAGAFQINDQTANQSHEFSEFFTYDLYFAVAPGGNGLSRPVVDGEMSGLTSIATRKTVNAGHGSKLYMKVHSNNNNDNVTGRFVLEMAPNGTTDPMQYEVLVSDMDFLYTNHAEFSLVLDRHTAFWKHTPHERLRFDPAAAEGPFYPPFENVVGAGYYFQSDVTANVGVALRRVSMRVFDFDAVPPPNTATLLFLK